MMCAQQTADVRKLLAEAEAELDDLEEYAAEMDLPPPDLGAKEVAKNILRQIIQEFPRPCSVSPWSDGTVVIQPEDGLVTIFCDARGAISVFDDSPEDGTIERHAGNLNPSVMAFIRNVLRKSE